MSRPRLELSGVQVVATVLAAVTGAILASSLGVVGTVAGTAIASAASTTATAIYRHYLGRGKEHFHQVAPVIAKKAHWWEENPAASDGKTAASPTGPARPKTTVAGDAPTREQPAVKVPSVPAHMAARVPTFTPHDKSAPRATPARQAAPTAQEIPAVHASSNGNGADLGSRLREWRGRLWNRRVLGRYWLPASAAFVVVLVCITGFELAVGRPVSSVVWGKSGSGTTIGNVFGGSSSSKTTKQPSTGASTSTGQTSAPSTSTTPSPSPATTSPAATPSPSSSTGANDNTNTGSNAGADDSTPSTNPNAG